MLWSSSSKGVAGEGGRGAGRRPLGALDSRLPILLDDDDKNLFDDDARAEGDLERAFLPFRSPLSLMGLMISESSPTGKCSGVPCTPKGVAPPAMADDPDGPSATLEFFGILAALP